MILALSFGQGMGMAISAIFVLILVAVFIMAVMLYRKVEQGQALVRNGVGGTKVTFTGILVWPVIHMAEVMDISVKRIEIYRHDEDGLVCKDNIRADIKVAYFVRVNSTEVDVLKVAQSVGCVRASEQTALVELFDAKFSEALKTAGKQFDFADLYTSRDQFKEEILKVIGTDLNGFVLEDAAIDYLEQTPLSKLDETNILDAEGIKKITELTAVQKILANQIERNKEKTITKENVEAQEAILELNRQLAESEERQKREILSIKAREEAEAKKVQQEELLRSESARINTAQEVGILEENRQRQIIVAEKNKQRTEAIETERVEKDRLLEVTEKERIVTLAQIEKEKIIETEKKNIQEVIRQRVELEKTVVIEQERIKDTEAFAGADRTKRVAVTAAEQEAEVRLVKDIKAAEAAKKAAELKADEHKYKDVTAASAAKEASLLKAEEMLTLADADEKSAVKHSAAKKFEAEAITATQAAPGLAEANVIAAKADAIEKQGAAEANVLELKFSAEAKGINEKADAMKNFDGVGREHEEFKLRLNKDKEIEMAEINVQKDIAAYQAEVLGQALKSAKIDIVGGESQFFDKLVNSITQGKSIDRMVDNSRVLRDVKETFFNGDPEYFQAQFQKWITQFGIKSDDVRNLSIAGVLGKMITAAEGSEIKGTIERALKVAEDTGLADKPAKPFVK
jgi:flotillin